MSDGPYRTLRMTSAWKSFAEFAHKTAFEPSDVAGALRRALAADWRTENCGKFIGAMRDILGDGNQKSLFEGQEAANLESLRRMTAAFPLQKLMLDEVIQSVADGQTGPDALQEGIANACLERALRGVR